MKIKVKKFDLGPILGAVSTDAARIWGRGQVKRSSRVPRRMFGVARIRKLGTGAFGPPRYFKLNPNFDMTGITVFTRLQPDTEYEYEAGAFFSDLEFEDLEASAKPNWAGAHRGRLRTASANPAATRSFVFGSCRYLLKLFGGAWFDDRGDKTFRSILRQLDSGRRIDQLLMLGDQIYADDLLFIKPDESADDYLARYRDAFSQAYIAQLMSRVPTYMTLDDHEIENNWPQHATKEDRVKKFPAAMHAFMTYQLSHSPLFAFGDDGRLTGHPDHYWYRFDDGCCEFFIMDARTERARDAQGQPLRMMNSDQMSALKEWLADGSGRVKLIGSSVPVFPDLPSRDSDRWDAYPEQRNELLDHIRDNNVRRVVFLSGDVHSSMSAELRHDSSPGFKVISVVSSPFYWPYPHSYEKDFQMSGALAGAPGYTVHPGRRPISTDNFARVTATPERLKVEFFGRKGEKMAPAKTHQF